MTALGALARTRSSDASVCKASALLTGAGVGLHLTARLPFVVVNVQQAHVLEVIHAQRHRHLPGERTGVALDGARRLEWPPEKGTKCHK